MQNVILSTCSIPDLVNLIACEIEGRLLDREKNTSPPAADPERWMNLQDLIDYLPDHPKPQTVYSWCHNKLIPYSKKGKKLLFQKSAVDAWMESGHRRTFAQMQADAKQPKR